MASMCKFCAREKAALLVEMPALNRKKRSAISYCLTCYYTTSAVRQNPEKYVSISDEAEQRKQLPAIQQLFSECFLELQQELEEESVRSFQNQQQHNNKDPLAMLNFSSSTIKKRKSNTTKGRPPDPKKKREGDKNDGGFLREITVPERLKKTQQEQEEQLKRSNHAATVARRASRQGNSRSVGNNKRRKGSGRSIWNLAMDQGRDGSLSTKAVSYKTASTNANLHNITCSCGSNNLHNFGNVTSRNQDARKGEIWGSGDRNEVIYRYQCNSCGRTWNEEE